MIKLHNDANHYTEGFPGATTSGKKIKVHLKGNSSACTRSYCAPKTMFPVSTKYVYTKCFMCMRNLLYLFTYFYFLPLMSFGFNSISRKEVYFSNVHHKCLNVLFNMKPCTKFCIT